MALFISLSTSNKPSLSITLFKLGLIAGNFGKNTVQQSSYGSIEVSKVPISSEIL